METLQTAALPISRDRVSGEKFPNRPRAATEARDASNPRTVDISRPGHLPRGFESMLKTTTETGDIGMFSIKPSRVPQSFSTPRRSIGAYSDSGVQRPKQPFQPYGVPIIDDRRRLPSYARDAASDATSMYETASQKSANRAFEESDYRSYSMTQTSYSSYTLSNHKSYASLRSQQNTSGNGGGFSGGNGLLQRPRSPFAYPTRLKRPGFRPSSPALTDGGLVDYSRRAEIDRLTYGPGHSTSSPSSLYALKRKPPLALRPEGNRSTPSLLSQSSPHRRSSSPQTFTSSGHDWSRRNGAASVNTSPARSTFSLASTVNIRASATATSVTTTPGKITPSSPLYYDYTEDFEVEECCPPELLPPPPFTIDKTIPEDRPMSSHGPIAEARASETGHKNGPRVSFPLPPQSPRSSESTLNSARPVGKDVETRAQPLRIHDHALPDGISSLHHIDGSRDKEMISLSASGYGAHELRSRVEGPFDLRASASVGLGFSLAAQRNASVNSEGSNQSSEHIEKRNDALSSTGNTNQQYLTTQDIDLSVSIRDPANVGQLQRISESNVQPPGESARQRFHSRGVSQEAISSKDSPACSSVIAQWNTDPSGGLSMATGLVDLCAMAAPSELKNSSQKTGPGSVMSNPRLVAKKTGLQHAASNHSFTAPISSFNPQILGENKHPRVQESSRNKGYHHGRMSRPPMLSEYKPPSVPNFSHQMRKPIARQESLMIAPKPISPARQLKLKNSIPQLMKALPPLPPELESLGFPPPTLQKSKELELSHRLSNVLANTFSETIQAASEFPVANRQSPLLIDIASADQVEKPLPGLCQTEPEFQKSPLETREETCLPPLPPPKLKLKLKASNIIRPQSPLETRPWNLKESYPWESREENILLPSKEEKENKTSYKQPRFKLKVTRASLVPRGTVRIHRISGDERSAGLQLRNPKDLFSPTSGVESVFRRVSSHMHSRRASTASSLQAESEFAATLGPEPLRVPLDEEPSPELPTTHLSPTSNALNLCEARSCFSDDSSQEEGQNGLRRRLTNLKSKIPVPYVSRAATQSHDDITWKDRNGGDEANLVAARIILNAHGGSAASTDTKPTRRLAERIHRQKLRTKMQGWLKGARDAIAARVKTRSAVH